MKTQAGIRAEIDQLLEEDRIEESDALVEELIPISAEEFKRRMDEAAYDDEPVTAEDRAVFDRFWASLGASGTPVVVGDADADSPSDPVTPRDLL